MLLKNTYSLYLCLILSGCGVLIGNPTSPNEEGDDTLENGDDIAINGRYTNEYDANLLLLADNIFLQCQTISDSANICRQQIDLTTETPEFNLKCKNFANTPFACYIENDDYKLANVKISDGSSIISSGGTLQLDIDYETILGYSDGNIDTTKTTAKISTENPAVANEPNFSNSWLGECAEEQLPGFYCHPDQDQLYVDFTDFTNGKQRYSGLWWDKSRLEHCSKNTGTEAKPYFQITFDGTSYPINIENEGTFITTIDQLYSKLPTDLQSEIKEIARSRISDDITYCDLDYDFKFSGENPCTTSTAYPGLYKVQANEIRRATMNLFRKADYEVKEICENLVKQNFTFNDCDKDNAPFICEQMQPVLAEVGLKRSGSTLTKDSDWSQNYFAEFSITNIICPTTSENYKTILSSGNDFTVTTYNESCRNEFLNDNSTAYTQAKTISQLTDRWLPSAAIITCPRTESDPLRNNILTSLVKSCAPSAEYSLVCDANSSCDTLLTCAGSSDGNCYDKQNTYQGEILGREGLLKYKAKTTNQFELSNIFRYSWFKWDKETQKPTQCHFAEKLNINITTKSQDAFSSIVNQSSRTYCENDKPEPYAGGDMRLMNFRARDK